MKKSVFDPELQQLDLSSKMVSGLERVSQAFKVLLWDKAKGLGLSPIQIQLLIFCAHHKSDLRNVSTLAREFNVTKPTISDAVRVLHKKALIEKIPSPTDGRAYNIQLTETGKNMVAETEQFAKPIQQIVTAFSSTDQQHFFRLLNQLIFHLNKQGIIQVQRSCRNCRFYESQTEGHYCRLLAMPLTEETLRLDCPEFEAQEA